MTVHKLSAGSGYTYLTRQVAAGDHQVQRGQELSDYYVVDGNPPGEWWGKGAAVLGVSGQVSEAQMKALFGEGLHPNADAMIASAIEGGRDPEQAIAEAQLGRRFPRFELVEDQAWNSAMSAAVADFREQYGREPEAGVERDLMRWNVAGELLAGKLGGDPSDAERYAFLAERGRSQRQAVSGFDLVFSPVKSVSVLWALGDDQVRGEVEEAHRAAWRSTMEWIEKEGAVTRTGAGGVAQIDATGLAATAFEHHDSRAGDPDLHTHVAVSSKVQGADGKWRSLDARVLHALAVTASERYATQIEAELVERLGVTFEDHERGGTKRPVREIKGINQEVCRGFSARRQAIEGDYAGLLADFRREHGHDPDRASQLRLLQQATLATRPAKDEPQRLSEQRATWRARAASMVGGVGQVDEMVAEALSAAPSPRRGWTMMAGRMVHLAGMGIEELGQLAVESVAERRSTWTRWNVEAEAERLARLKTQCDGGDSRELADQIAGVAVAASSIRIDAPEANPVPFVMRRADGESIYRVHGGVRFTSTAILDVEDGLLQAARTTAGPTIDASVVDRAIAAAGSAGPQLDEGQAAMVRHFASGGHQIEVAIGPAGTGKTTAARAFARAVEAGGGRVIGLAPSAVAAGVLADDLGVRADTLDKLLWAHQTAASPDQIDPHLRLDASTFLLVDEAGMAGTPKLGRLLKLAQEHGAVVRLMGDPAQLAAVEAGGALRLIANRVDVVRLEQIHRFVDPAEAAASLALRDGDIEGLDYYVQRGRIVGGSREALMEEMYANWTADTQAGRAVMVAPSNADVVQLNTRARLDRIERGDVEAAGIELHDGTQAGRGDLVVTRTNDRRLTPAGDRRGEWVRNGDIWHVRERRADGSLLVHHAEAGHAVVLPAEYVRESVELAYAATVHRVQGMTVDRCHALVEAGSSRENLYVAATRGRESNRLYVVTDPLIDAGADAEHAPETSRAAIDVLGDVLRHDSAERSAHEAIEELLNESESLARLIPEYEDGLTRIEPSRDEQLAEQVRDIVGSRDRAMADAIVTDPAWPALAARLAAHADAGADLGELLPAAIAQRELDSADSLAEVLHWRVGEPAAIAHSERWEALPSWLSAPPTLDSRSEAANGVDQAVHGWVERQGDLITKRVDHLVDRALVGNEAWMRILGPAPAEHGRQAEAWAIAARTVSAYRDQYRVLGSDPLGAEPTHGRQRVAYRQAEQALSRWQQARTAQPEQPAPGGEDRSRRLAQVGERLKRDRTPAEDQARAERRRRSPEEIAEELRRRGPRM